MSIKYYIKGTVKGTIVYNDATPIEDVPDYCLSEYSEEIEELFKDDNELAQYIWEDEPIYGVVTEIRVGVKIIEGSMYSWTEVTANRELNESEKENLLDYLTGQFSDGYGEGLEQHEFFTETDYESYEEWDDEEEEYYEAEYEYTTWHYFHLWQAKNFKLEFVEDPDKKIIEDLKIAVEDEDITVEEFEVAKNIEFNINGEDYGLFLSQIKEIVPLNNIKSVSYIDLKEFDGGYRVILANGVEKHFGWHFKKFGLTEVAVKPRCKLIGEDGNIFNLMGIASRTLRQAGMSDKASEMTKKITLEAKDYDHALRIIMEYVEVI